MSIPPPNLTERNWSVLGLLRFLLAFSVMSCHTTDAVSHLDWLWTFGGFIAVAGFFLISGFSIAHSLHTHPRHYLRRRVMRIYPLVLVSIAYTLILLWSCGVPFQDVNQAEIKIPPFLSIAAVACLLNGMVIATPFIFHPLWSLSCEILYYLAAPLLRLMPTAVVFCLIALSAGDYILNHSPLPDANHGMAVTTLAWLWLLGYGAYSYKSNRAYTIITVVGGGYLIGHYGHDGGRFQTVTYWIAAFLVCNVATIRMPARLVPTATYLGEISFPLYLFHFPTILALSRFTGGWPIPVAIAVCWVASLTAAIMAYHLVDQPLRKKQRPHLAISRHRT